MSVFHFRQFDVRNEKSAMKVNTDGVLLGAVMDVGGHRLLDIGTGTGTIALMAAQRNQEAQITAIDIDEASAEEAAANFAASPWGGRLEALNSPLQEFAAQNRNFDLIFSNPPYFDNSLTNPEERKTDARHTATLSYRDIFAYAEGSLAGQSGPALADGGRIALVLPSEEEQRLLREGRSRGFFPTRITRVRTTPKKAPKRIIAEFSRERTDSPAELMMTLENEGRRTREYIDLTKDFYTNI